MADKYEYPLRLPIEIGKRLKQIATENQMDMLVLLLAIIDLAITIYGMAKQEGVLYYKTSDGKEQQVMLVRPFNRWQYPKK